MCEAFKDSWGKSSGRYTAAELSGSVARVNAVEKYRSTYEYFDKSSQIILATDYDKYVIKSLDELLPCSFTEF